MGEIVQTIQLSRRTSSNFLKQTNSPLAYAEQFSLTNTQHRYRAIRLWEVDPTPLLSNPGLLPLAALAQTDSPRDLLEQIAERVDEIEERQTQGNIATCVELLARLRFDQNTIRQFLRVDSMRESPLYQEIIEEGLQQGEQRIVIRQLLRRIGEIPPEVRSQIQQLPIPQIEELSEALLDFSRIEDLTTWLRSHS